MVFAVVVLLYTVVLPNLLSCLMQFTSFDSEFYGWHETSEGIRAKDFVVLFVVATI